MPLDVLSDEQLRQFERDGFLLVPGLVPDPVAAGAAEAMWRCLGVSAKRPAEWRRLSLAPQNFRDAELLACFSNDCVAAAAQLSGEPAATFVRPRRAYCVNVFPSEQHWKAHVPHIDHSNVAARHRVFPRPMRIASMTYLNDVEPHSGGTMVWPGSHRLIEALARSDPARFRLMAQLNAGVPSLDLGRPVELTPRRGDVLYYHYLCAHAGSLNVGATPRFALSWKW